MGLVANTPGSEPGRGHWLLVRRSIADPEDLAYCFGTGDVSLAELALVAGTRWIIEDAFKEAKQEVGLDEYQVRLWVGSGTSPWRCWPMPFSGGNPVLPPVTMVKGGYVPGRTHPTDRVRRLYADLWLPRGSPTLTIQ